MILWAFKDNKRKFTAGENSTLIHRGLSEKRDKMFVHSQKVPQNQKQKYFIHPRDNLVNTAALINKKVRISVKKCEIENKKEFILSKIKTTIK